MIAVSLIIPAYNEADIIQQTVVYANKFLREHFISYEIIIVDDGSTDGTASVALSGGKVELISYVPNRGKGYAIRQGVQSAKGKYILFMDADMAYPFDYIISAVAFLQDSDIVIGSRYIDTVEFNPYPIHRRLLSWGFANYVNRTLHLNITDTQCGFKAFRADAAKNIFSYTKINDFTFDVELLFIAQQLGYKILELPVTMQRCGSSTKVKMFRDSAKMFNQVLQIKKQNSIGIPYEKYEH